MTSLLCAIMVGTHCVSWQPKEVKKSDIKSYYSAILAERPGIEEKSLRLIGVSWGTDFYDICVPDGLYKQALANLIKHPDWYCGSEHESCVYFSVTKKQYAQCLRDRVWNSKSPLEQQNLLVKKSDTSPKRDCGLSNTNGQSIASLRVVTFPLRPYPLRSRD